MSFTKTTTYTVTIEIRQELPDRLVADIKDILNGGYESPKIEAIKHLRNGIDNLCGNSPSLRDVKDIVEDIMSSMPDHKEDYP